jgi:hypothetical protein
VARHSTSTIVRQRPVKRRDANSRLLDGAKLLQPFQQGELDYFCGLYAIINGLRLSLATVRPLSAVECLQLFKQGLAYLNERGRLPLCRRSGLAVTLWHQLAAELAREASIMTAAQIRTSFPFSKRRRVTLGNVFTLTEAMIDEHSPVLLLLEATNRHFTVISGYTRTRLWLFDSSGQSWINRSSCDTADDADKLYQIHGRSVVALRL